METLDAGGQSSEFFESGRDNSPHSSILDAALLDNSAVPDIQFAAPTQQLPSANSLRSIATQRVDNNGKDPMDSRLRSVETALETVSKQVAHLSKALDRVTQSTIANQEHGAKLRETIGALHGQLGALEKLSWKTFEDLTARAAVIEENQTLLAQEVATGGAISENVMTRFITERMEANQANTAIEQRTMMSFIKELTQALKAERVMRDEEMSKIKKEVLQGAQGRVSSATTTGSTKSTETPTSAAIKFDSKVLEPDNSVQTLQMRLAEIEMDMQRLTADLAKPGYGPSIEELKMLRSDRASGMSSPPRGAGRPTLEVSDGYYSWRGQSPGPPAGASAAGNRSSPRPGRPADNMPAHISQLAGRGPAGAPQGESRFAGSSPLLGPGPARGSAAMNNPPGDISVGSGPVSSNNQRPMNGQAGGSATAMRAGPHLQPRVAYSPQGASAHLLRRGDNFQDSAASNRSNKAPSLSSWRSGHQSTRSAAPAGPMVATSPAPSDRVCPNTGARPTSAMPRASPQTRLSMP
mmetsp:Transcript_36595/g.67062  ORF Transcript_36595/g.67062 Transcript_36595/m.67062 type:complete len:524 (-) Transcript_36595:125-1696(-)